MKKWERSLVVLMIALLSANLILGQLTARASDEINQNIIDPTTIEVASPVEPSQVITEEVAEENTEVEAPAEEVQPEVTEEADVENQETAETTEVTEEVTEEVVDETPQTFEAVVDDILITVTTNGANVIPEGAILTVEKIVQQVELEAIEEAINEDETIENPVQEMMAFDIKFMLDGQEVQPNGEVKVAFENIDIEAPAEEMSVVHIDEEMNVTDMEAAPIEGEEGLEFETTHFSIYVIVKNTGGSQVQVTINHFDNTVWGAGTGDTGRIYLSDTVKIPAGGSLFPANKATNWEPEKIEVVVGTTKTEYKDLANKLTKEIDPETNQEAYALKITKNCTINIFYKPVQTPEKGETTFYDYTVKAGEGTGGGNQWVEAGTMYNWMRIWITESGSGYTGNSLYRNEPGWSTWKSGWNGDGWDDITACRDGYVYGTGQDDNQYKDKQLKIDMKTKKIYAKGGTKKTFSINMPDETNWDPGTKSQDTNDNLTVGKVGQYDEQIYTYTREYLYGERAWNKWTGGTQVSGGLLTRLEANGKPSFAYNNPGFFYDFDWSVDINGTSKYLRKIYKDFKLDFDKKGDSYKLTGVSLNGTSVTTAGDHFYPLDYVETGIQAGKANAREKDRWQSYDEVNQSANAPGIGSDGLHNFFFGMRYDIDFTIGDYCGPMRYYFSGDDDMWAILTAVNDDGTLDTKRQMIISDQGGVHTASQDDVDLWKDVLSKSKAMGGKFEMDRYNKDDPNRNQKFRLTILYMERGANYSNCNMEFTIPNAQFIQVDTNPETTLNINKVETGTTTGLAEAEFRLVNTDNGYDRTAITSAEDGKVGTATFGNLKAGTYKLTETKAPDGYLDVTGEWTIVVTKISNTEAKITSVKNPEGTELINIWNDVLTIENTPKPTPKSDTPDTTYIQVEKIFRGLTKAEIEALNFQITITGNNYNQSFGTGVALYEELNEKEHKYTWIIDGLEGDSYTVSETGYEVNNKDLIEVTMNGTPVMESGNAYTGTVTTKTSNMVLNQTELITNCNKHDGVTPYTLNNFTDTSFIVAWMVTDNKDLVAPKNEFFVWTYKKLSVSERNILYKYIENVWHTTGDSEKVAFFSGKERIYDVINWRGGEARLEDIPNDINSKNLYFKGAKLWKQFAYGNCSFTAAENAEITVTNTYAETGAILDIQKYGSEYIDNQLAGSTFNLTKGTLDNGVFTWEENPIKTFDPTTEAEYTADNRLKAGYYKLEEQVAPGGFVLLGETIYLKVDGTTVSLVDESGNATAAEQTMWKLITETSDEDTSYKLKIKNEVLYSLPSTGGIGIYVVIFGGAFLMALAAGLLILRRKSA